MKGRRKDKRKDRKKEGEESKKMLPISTMEKEISL